MELARIKEDRVRFRKGAWPISPPLPTLAAKAETIVDKSQRTPKKSIVVHMYLGVALIVIDDPNATFNVHYCSKNPLPTSKCALAPLRSSTEAYGAVLSSTCAIERYVLSNLRAQTTLRGSGIAPDFRYTAGSQDSEPTRIRSKLNQI